MSDYNPTIQSWLERTEDDWGNPVENRKNLIPYGIKPFDLALYGINPAGELIIIQGPEKNRKTTMWLNVIDNIFTWKTGETIKPVVNIDVLETGMPPGKIRDSLISIRATKILVSEGHAVKNACPVCKTDKCKELGISPHFLMYNSRSQSQMRAINKAMAEMSEWKVLLHGPKGSEGETRNLDSSIRRWKNLIEEYGMGLLVTDHLQQYNTGTSDYERLLKAVDSVGNFSAANGIPVIAVSQISLTSYRESKATGDKMIATGGSKAAQEANTVFSVTYTPGTGMVTMKIEESRYAGSFAVFQPIEDTSGAFIGEAVTSK